MGGQLPFKWQQCAKDSWGLEDGSYVNIEPVRRLILQSPKRSARKHASVLALSNRTFCWILLDDLQKGTGKIYNKHV